MPCRVIPIGGGFAIACGPGSRPKQCKAPGCGRPSIALCDWKLHRVGDDGKRVYTGKTCDAPMCEVHRFSVGTNKDLCGPHLKMADEQGFVQR